LAAMRHLTWAEIDLDALAHNVRLLLQRIGNHTEIIGVVKANAYGHGAIQVSRKLVQCGVTRLGVGRTAEAVQLRSAGIDVPILLMCYTLSEDLETIVRLNLTPTLNTWEQAQAISSLATAHNRTVPIHIKVDTGMGRYGLLPDEVVPFARSVADLPGVHVEGFCTHFAEADARDRTYTERQLRTFLDLVDQLRDSGVPVPLRHVANSAATLDLPAYALDAVRCGLVLYGMSPSQERPLPLPLRPVMSLKSRVARVRVLPQGACISYGCTYQLCSDTPVALVPVGYGDGYHRSASGRASVLIGGQRAPIAGRVCMDQFVADITGIDHVREDEEVVLFGKQGDAEITADEVAEWAGTINYEVTTSILPRVPRVYLEGEQIVAVSSLVESWSC
jgi:alanine racemase